MTSEPAVPRHFWYDDSAESASGVDVLNLLRRYRDAETTMRSRVRADMDMGEKDILALRHLISADRAGTVSVTVPSPSAVTGVCVPYRGV